MTHYSMKSKTRKDFKGYGFLSFGRNLSDKYGKKLLDTSTKAGLDALKTVSKSIKQILVSPEQREEILNELKQVL